MSTRNRLTRSSGLSLATGAVLFSAAGTGCMPGNVNAPAPPVERTVSFADDIQPIFDKHCVQCHRVDGFANLQGIVMLLTEGDALDSVVNQASSQNPALSLVVPGDADSSLLFQKVSSNNPPVGATMPLFGKALSSEELGLLRDWIDQGALDN